MQIIHNYITVTCRILLPGVAIPGTAPLRVIPVYSVFLGNRHQGQAVEDPYIEYPSLQCRNVESIQPASKDHDREITTDRFDMDDHRNCDAETQGEQLGYSGHFAKGREVN